ncbi:MAG: GAF domain-containing protein, partial [Gammaproteobacteria bacterium]
ISNQLWDDARVERALLEALQAERQEPLQNAAAVPLTVKGQVVGTLILIDKQGGQADFDESDLALPTHRPR